MIIAIIVAVSSNNKEDNTVTPNNTGKNNNIETAKESPVPAKATPTPAPKTKKYTTGTYLVGKDIQSGLYRVILKDTITKIGYIERAKDVNMEASSIIANIILTGNGYVEILKTDVAVKLQGVEIEPITLADLKPALQKELTNGIYLVGYDIAPGTYKTEITDTVSKTGYVQRSRSVAMGSEDIIANDLIQGPGYVKIEKGDFAVLLQGVKITLQE